MFGVLLGPVRFGTFLFRPVNRLGKVGMILCSSNLRIKALEVMQFYFVIDSTGI